MKVISKHHSMRHKRGLSVSLSKKDNSFREKQNSNIDNQPSN
jgi:hypothetical protein